MLGSDTGGSMNENNIPIQIPVIITPEFIDEKSKIPFYSNYIQLSNDPSSQNLIMRFFWVNPDNMDKKLAGNK